MIQHLVLALILCVSFPSILFAQDFENALHFDGTNDYIALPPGADLNTANFTFEAWVKWEAPFTSPWQRVMDFGSSTDRYMFLAVYNDNSFKPRFAIRTETEGEQIIDGNIPLSDNKWHHIAVTIDDVSNTGKMYVDGVVSGSNTNMTLTPSDLGSTLNNWIGRSQFNADPYFKGTVDQVRIWSVARSKAEIIESMSMVTPAVTTGLIASYQFNHGITAGANAGVTNLLASPSASFNGTLTNFGLTGALSNWVRSFINVSSISVAETFDSGAHGWMSSGTNNSWGFGTPAKTVINSAHSVPNSWITGGLTGNHPNNESSFVRSPAYNFLNATVPPTVSFWIWKNLEVDYDGAVLQQSLDGTNWTTIGTLLDPVNWYDTQPLNSFGNIWGGSSGGWIKASHVLGNDVIGQSTVSFRLWFRSDPAVVLNGFAFDDFAVTPSGISTNTEVAALGNCLDFDGIDDYVYTPTYGLSGDQSFTLEMWMYWKGGTFGADPYDPNSPSNFQRAINIGGSNGNETCIIMDAGRPSLRIGGIPTANDIVYGSTITQNKWTHVAATYDAVTKRGTIYIDGNKFASKIFAVTPNLNEITTLGRMAWPNNNRYFFGSLDEVRVWSHVRSQLDIKNDLYNTLSGAEDNLLNLYSFNEGDAGKDNSSIGFAKDSGPWESSGELFAFARAGSTSNFISSKIGFGAITVLTIEPAASLPGKEVRIFGNNFSSNRLSNHVFIGDQQAEILQATPQFLRVLLPESFNATGNTLLYVTTPSGSSHPAFFARLYDGVDFDFKFQQAQFGGGLQGAGDIQNADIDQDGLMDVVTTDFNMLNWFRNLGDGTFSTKTAISIGPNTIKVVDLDKDGDPDIVTGNNSSNLTWYTNSAATFSSDNVLTAAAGRVNDIDVADFDRNGTIDIVAGLVGSADKGIYWFSNNGSLSFVRSTIYVNGQDARGVTAADIDNDGDMDVLGAIANGTSLDISLYGNNGAGTFAKTFLFTMPSVEQTTFHVADVTGDNYSDIFVFSYGGSYLLKNNGNGTFQAAISFPTYVWNAVTADVEGDGDLDLIAGGRATEFYLLKNDGQGNFTIETFGAAILSGVNAVATADYDADGDMDVAIVSASDAVARQYKNVKTENDILSFQAFNQIGDTRIRNSNGKIKSEYFNNDQVTGSPVITMDETSIDHDYGFGSPYPAISGDNFSVRWTFSFLAPSTGMYTFHTTTDDGVRFYIDDVLVIDKWIGQPLTEWTTSMQLSADQTYTVKMEYQEQNFAAAAKLEVSGPALVKQLATPAASVHSIDISVPNSTLLNAIVPVFETSFASSVKVNNEIQTSGSSSQSFIVGLEPTPITYSVVADDNSKRDWTVAMHPVPAQPVANSISAVTETAATINWTNGTFTDSNLVDVSTDNFATFVTGYAAKATSGSSHTVTGLSPGMAVQIRLRGKNAYGLSETYSNVIAVVTLPSAPAVTASNVGQTTATASWTKVDGASSYLVDVSKDNFSTFVQPYNGFETVTSNVAITGLSEGSNYRVRVRSLNASGTSSNSTAASIVTVPSNPLATSPTFVSTSSFIANWNEVTGASVYDVEVSETDFATISLSMPNQTGSSVTIENLVSGNSYKYRVRALNSSGASSGNSNTPSAITLPVAPSLDPVTGLTQRTATLSWGEVNGAPGFQLDLSRDNFSTFVQPFNNYLINTNNFQLTDLTAGVRYYFRIRSMNASGTSPNFATAAFVTAPPEPIALEPVAKTSSGFVARWNDASEAASYVVELSDNNFTSILATNPTQNTSSSFSGLELGKTYAYRVRALNASGSSAYSNAIVVVPAYSISITGQTFDANTKVAGITAISSVAIDAVRLFYRGISTGDFESVNVPLKSGNTYQVTLTADMQDEMGTEYYFLVRDDLEDERKGELSYYYRRIDASEKLKIPLARAGTGSSNYNLFSIPFVLDDPAMESVFEPLLGRYDDTKWRLLRHQDNRNVEYGDGLNRVEPGFGYWLTSKKQVDIQISEGSVVTANRVLPFEINLQKGWNQVGNPFPFDVSWSKVVAFNKDIETLGKLYVFEGNGFREGDLHFWGGGFVKASREVTIQIPVTARVSSGGRKKGDEKPSGDLALPEWTLELTLEQGTSVNDLGAIGMHPDASLSNDRFDEQSLPRFIKYLELNSYHEEYFMPRFMRDIVPTSVAHNWEVEAESNQGDGKATLRWDPEVLGSGEEVLLLYDKNSRELIDMKKHSSYQFSIGVGRSLIFLFAIDNQHLLSEMNGVGLPYPNPFTDGVSIPFVTRSKEQRVECHIYDLFGKPVKILSPAQLRQNFDVITWDGTDEKSTRVSSGIYFYRITLGNSYAKTGRLVLN
jgi:hypothetical protein